MASTGEAALLERAGVEQSSAAASTRATWMLPVLVLALAVLPKLPYLWSPIGTMDESVLLVYPEQISAGRIPHADFFSVYGPGNYVLLAAVYALTGPSMVVEHLVGIGYQVALVGGLMFLTRRFGTAARITAGVAAAVLLSGPAVLATSWPGGIALAVWGLALLSNGRGRAVFLGGVLAGLAVCFRYELGLLLLPALPFMWRDRRALPYIAGGLVGLLPTFVQIALAGRAVFDNVIFQRAGVNSQRDWSLLTPGIVGYLVVLLAAVVGLAVVAVRRQDRFSLAMVLLAVALLPQVLQRIDFGHVAGAACVVLPALFASLTPTTARRLPSVPRLSPVVAVVLTAFVALMTGQAAATTGMGTVVEHDGRALYATPDHAAWLEDITESVSAHVPPGDRVFMGSTDMALPAVNAIELYHLLPEYRSDFYYFEILGGVANQSGSPLVGDIESADALVLTETPASYYEQVWTSGRGSEEANAVVRRGFCVVDRLPNVVVMTRAACTD